MFANAASSRALYQPEYKPEHKPKYRPEIDGIRALAVIAVIINHFNPDGLPSGYLGVDIFFVLSGFVITLSLLGRASKSLGDFLMSFYSRRIKRLVPALLLFVVVNSILICLFNPDPKESLETGIAALFGLSNLYLFKETTDYFAASTVLNVFTHTWSLGVEEQFYSLFPFLAWFTGFSRLSHKGIQSLFNVVIALAATSLIAFIYLYPQNEAAAYFLMPTRLWEIGAGCLLFLSLQNSSSWIQKLKNFPPSAIAITIIVLLFAPTPFAILTTIAIVILTALLITCLQPKTTTYHLFTHPKATYIGRLSYSLYLWHWSVLSISRWTIGIHWWTIPFQTLLIILLAAVSYHYIETPLRHLRWAHLRWQSISKGIGASAVVASLLIVAIKTPQLSLYIGQRPSIEAVGVASLTEKYALWSSTSQRSYQWHGHRCVLWSDSRTNKKISIDNCTLGDFSTAKRRVLVLGDSFSAAFTQAFDKLVTSDNYAITIVSSFGSSPVKAIPTQETSPQINNYYWDSVVPQLIDQLKPDDWVFLINNMRKLSPEKESPASKKRLQQLKNGLMQLSEQLSSKRVRLAVLHGTPFTQEPDCPPVIAAQQWFSFAGGPCQFPSRARSLSQRNHLDNVLSTLETAGHLNVIDLFNIYCPDKRCNYNAANGQMLYRDEYGHPSIESARLSAPTIRTALTAHKAE